MKEDIKIFLAYLSKEKNYSQNTLSAYSNDLNQLATYVESEGFRKGAIPSNGELNAEALAGYMYNLKDKKYASSTVARKIAAAKSFLKFMADNGKLKKDLSSSLVSPQVNKSVPKSLSIAEVRRLLAEPAKLPTPEAKRDKTMMELLYATGLRASELMALNLEDIDFVKSSVKCKDRDRGFRFLPIDQYMVKVVKEYIDIARAELLRSDVENALFLNRRGERLTRQGFWQIISGYSHRAGFTSKVTPRVLRHSFATHRLKSGVNLQSLQELLGHAHLSTTRVYKQAEM